MMTTKRFVLATVSAFLISNILTSLWYMLMDGPNEVPFRRETMNYGLLMANHVIYAGLMVYFYSYHFAQRSTVSAAFIFGVLIAALMFIPQALVVRSIWTVDINPVFFLNTLAHLVIGGVMAVAIFYLLLEREVKG